MSNQDFYSDIDLKYTEVAILMTTCNKYTPGTQTFYLQSLVPMKDKSNSIETEQVSASNLENKDISSITLSEVNTSSTIELEVPKEVTRNFPTKWIPPGTRFLVSFAGGNITKPQIVGRDY